MPASQLLLINPRRRRRRVARRRNPKRRMPAALRRYWAARSGRRFKNPRRRRARARRRSNPIFRRKRRHHARRRSNPRRYFRLRRYRRHRNPREGVGGTLVAGLIGAGGAFALNYAFTYINPYLPASMQTGLVQYATLGIGALGIGWLVSRFVSADIGNDVAFGGLAVVLYNALTSIAGSAGLTITNNLAGYADYKPMRVGAYLASTPNTAGFGARRTLGYVSPAPVLNGLGAYMKRKPIGAYMQPAPMNVAPSFGNWGDGM
jgi:hypothetical protein